MNNKNDTPPCEFEIVAHRGAATVAPENTIQAFQTALGLGADAVELDVRLTRDRVPVVFHYFYLDEITNLTGPIFNYTLQELNQAEFQGPAGLGGERYKISTLAEVLDTIGGRLGLEIEIKGPEPEAPDTIGELLWEYRSLWQSIGITSYEPGLLTAIKETCPGMVVDLLYSPANKTDLTRPIATPCRSLTGALHRSAKKMDQTCAPACRSDGAALRRSRNHNNLTPLHLLPISSPNPLDDPPIPTFRNSQFEILPPPSGSHHRPAVPLKFLFPKIRGKL